MTTQVMGPNLINYRGQWLAFERPFPLAVRIIHFRETPLPANRAKQPTIEPRKLVWIVCFVASPVSGSDLDQGQSDWVLNALDQETDTGGYSPQRWERCLVLADALVGKIEQLLFPGNSKFARWLPPAWVGLIHRHRL